MKTALQTLAHNLALLTAFEAKYQPGERECCVNAIDAETTTRPSLTFYVEELQWALRAFGREGWLDTDGEGEWRTLQKDVNGVLVRLYQCFHVPREPRRRPREVNPALLDGREAGIDLPSGSVQEVAT